MRALVGSETIPPSCAFCAKTNVAENKQIRRVPATQLRIVFLPKRRSCYPFKWRVKRRNCRTGISPVKCTRAQMLSCPRYPRFSRTTPRPCTAAGARFGFCELEIEARVYDETSHSAVASNVLAARQRRDAAKGTVTIERRARITEIRMVQDVHHIQPQFHRFRFVDSDL